MKHTCHLYIVECNQILKLAYPIVLSQIGSFIVQLSDTIMVGSIGPTQIAAVAFAGNIYFFLYIFSIGLTFGITPIVGKLFTQGNTVKNRIYFQSSLILYFILSIIICVLQLAIMPFFKYFGQPDAVIMLATPYYIVLSISTIPLVMFYVFKQFLEGIGNTKLVMIIVVGSNLLNILLNYILINGKCGVVAMECLGAGIATLISRIIVVITVVIYVLHNHKLQYYLHSFFSSAYYSMKAIKKVLKIGFPISMQMTLEGSTFAFTGIMMGWFGTTVLAANQIAIIIANLSYLVISGFSAATTIRISHIYGEKKIYLFKNTVYSAFIVVLIWNIFTILVLSFTKNHLPYLFTTDIKVVEMTSFFLIFVCMYQISDGIQNILIGFLRGVQKVKIILYTASFAYLIVNLPLGYLFAFKLHLGPSGLWCSYIFGLTFAAIILYRKSLGVFRTLMVSSKTVKSVSQGC